MQKPILLTLAVGAMFCLDSDVLAQGQSLASTMDVYVFPADGQDSSQQSKAEAECYEWAVGNVGTDPFDLSKQDEANQQQAQAEQEAAAQAGRGAGARGAVRGAAAGALKMPVLEFLFWAFIGKTLKMLLFALAGAKSMDWLLTLLGG